MVDFKKANFIPNKPIGNDFFDYGKAQKSLADGIMNYIIDQDSLDGKNANPKIIGIEGKWGSGKSNVVEIIKNKLDKEKYLLITYDAWGHQEDLHLRSILEFFTNSLLDDRFNNEITIRLRTGEEQTAPLDKQMNYLLSNKTTTITKEHPELDKYVKNGIYLFALFIIISFISSSLISIDSLTTRIIGGSIMFVYLLFCGRSFWKVYKKKGGKSDFLYNWITQKSENTVTEQYTSSAEPSVSEFHNWMAGLSNGLNGYKKVIIVFDNMDRLPGDKVRQLWACIYTFFAASNYENVWAIVPYDAKHINNVFKDSDDETNNAQPNETAIRYIKKTFPVIFNLAPPIIADFNTFFNRYFQMAFGDHEDRNFIAQVYRILNKEVNPREIISFINSIVVLYNMRKGVIRLRYIALYVMRKHEMDTKDNLDDYLLGNDMFKGVEALYVNIEETRMSVNMLAYGLNNKEIATQLPVKNTLEQLLKAGKKGVDRYIDRPYFMDVLINVINELPHASTDNIILALDTSIERNDSRLTKEQNIALLHKWDYLVSCKVKIPYQRQGVDLPTKALLIHASDKYKKKITEYFCEQMQKAEKISGKDYYDSFSTFPEGTDLQSLPLKEKEVEPKIFYDYVLAAGEKYPYFKLVCNKDMLMKWLSDNLGDAQFAKFLDVIRNDSNYDFGKLYKMCEDNVTKIPTSLDEHNVCNVLYTYRVLAVQNEQLLKTVSQTVVNLVDKLKTSGMTSQKGYEDLLFQRILLYNYEEPNLDDDLVARISVCFNYYTTVDDLIDKVHNNNSSIIKILKYLIENNISKVKDVPKVVQKITSIRQPLALEYNMLIDYIDKTPFDWNENSNQYVTNITLYLPESILPAAQTSKAKVIDILIKLAIQKMNTQPKYFLVNTSNGIVKNYWYAFVLNILGTKNLKKTNELLTGELMNAFVYLRTHQSESIMTDPLVVSLQKYVDTPLLLPLMNDEINGWFRSNKATPLLFKYYESWFRELSKDLTGSNAGTFIQNFVVPVSGDDSCLKTILEHKQIYAKLIVEGKPLTEQFINKVNTLAKDKPMMGELIKEIELYDDSPVNSLKDIKNSI